ncbi:hypothetical protein Leryth_007470 [Lithospermum erythrorhizon]|nr:hypothetical protein Leryth_007470 [Lithospermum erythrorhizon]
MTPVPSSCPSVSSLSTTVMDPNMSSWRLKPDGRFPAVTKGWLPPLLATSLLPLFWRLVCCPLRPARMGKLLLLIMPLIELSGTPPFIGNTWLFAFENGSCYHSILAAGVAAPAEATTGASTGGAVATMGVVAAGISSLGNAAEGGTTGGTSGTSLPIVSSGAPGAVGRVYCGVSSSRILTELAHPMVMRSKMRWKSLAILV